MDTEKIIWNKRIPAPMKKWVIGAANTADTPGEEAALRFGKWWSEHGTMVAVGSAAQGREGQEVLIHSILLPFNRGMTASERWLIFYSNFRSTSQSIHRRQVQTAQPRKGILDR